MTDPSSKSVFTNWPFWTLVAILFLWASTFFIYKIGLDRTEQGQFGDMFGAVNALFSGMAFWGLIITINQQRAEIDQQKKDESALRTQQFFLDQFKIIREDITGYAYIDRRGGAQFQLASFSKSDDASYVEIRGAEAFQKTMESFFAIGDKHKIQNSSKFKEFYAILVAIDVLINQVQTSNLNEDEKLNIRTLIDYTMKAKISPALDYCNSYISKYTEYRDIIPLELVGRYSAIMRKLEEGRKNNEIIIE